MARRCSQHCRKTSCQQAWSQKGSDPVVVVVVVVVLIHVEGTQPQQWLEGMQCVGDVFVCNMPGGTRNASQKGGHILSCLADDIFYCSCTCIAAM